MSGVERYRSSVCFVPGCKTGSSTDKELRKNRGEKSPSLFQPPKDPVTFQKWQRIIPRADKILHAKDTVCALHFPEEDILRFYETKLSDGTISRIERGKLALKDGSLPTFPNLPSYLSNNKKRRKSPCERIEAPIIKKIKNVHCQIGNFNSAGVEISNLTLEEIPDKPLVDNVIDPPFTLFENIKNVGNFNSAKVEISNRTLEEIPDNPLVDNGIDPALTLFENLKNNLYIIGTPNMQWTGMFVPGKNEVLFAELDDSYATRKQIVIRQDMSFKVLFRQIEIKLDGAQQILSGFDEIENILKYINKMKICLRIEQKSPSESCLGTVPSKQPGQNGPPFNRCFPCRMNILRDRKKVTKSYVMKRHEKLKGVVRCVTRKNIRLKLKINKLIKEVEDKKKKCAAVASETLEEVVSGLPNAQQEAVRTCFAAAKVSNPKNRRYTLAWIYECLLIRIKGKAVYEHLRSQKLLPLPCIDTLNKYISKTKGCYGFQHSTFELLKKKAAYMKPEERRGTLLIDEMKLTETLAFNSKTLQVNGFTDLGKYTPMHQKNQKGDHALVMMFQPFRGSWVQSLACFLSRGCASSTVLHHLIMECIILLEKTGFSIDVVTTDGASWNRSMWKKFNISEETGSCPHIYDPSRQLWFSSDFPHLIKNVRNFFTRRCETWTPDGVAKLLHWDEVVKSEQHTSFSLKICPRLSNDDVHPKHYQKMNVGRAYRFFSERTAAAMEIYKVDNPNLKDCDPSIQVIKRFSTLIDIMSSRTPGRNTLKPGSQEEKVSGKFIQDFLLYIQDWEKYTKDNNIYFLSDSTYHGLIVTLKSTLEVMKFLCNKYEFKYLMTVRLNQDVLERFFGMMRSSCGSNDHPDSRMFIQMYRLISTYSLVKPPKGSNVEGAEIMKSLLHIDEILCSEENTQKFQKSLDNILENDVWFGNDIDTNLKDHSYNMMRTSNFVLSYISGYIARKACRFSKCENCLQGLKRTEPYDEDKLIILLSKGSLIYPSVRLYALISRLESAILDVVSTNPVHQGTLLEILAKLEKEHVSRVGCDEHEENFTSSIIRFYLVSRMHFICKQVNRIDEAKKEKTKSLRKQSKL